MQCIDISKSDTSKSCTSKSYQLFYSVFLPLMSLSLCTTSAYANEAVDTAILTQADNEQSLISPEKKVDEMLEQEATILQADKSLQQQASENLSNDIQNDDVSADSLGINSPVVIGDDWSTEQIYAYLQNNTIAFERLLLQSIISSNTEALKTLLPAYDQYPAKDPSVIDWGNALIALEEGRLKDAVALYRKINAALPEVRLAHLQLAFALYQARQFDAAKNELQKLLRDDISDNEKKQLTEYIEAINRLDKWDYTANVSFTSNDNLDNAPAVGTKIEDGNSSLSYTTPHQSGMGFNYVFGANKKWSYDTGLFTALNVGLGGTYYWDNKKYNDLYTSASVGIGYQTATTEIQIAPNIARSWYGGGSSSPSNTGTIKPYTLSKGVRLSLSKWLDAKLMYQHSSQYTDLTYEKPYQKNNGKTYATSNGFFYAPDAQRYYTLYWNVSKKQGTSPAESYLRNGLNFGWKNTWDKGFSTLATLGVANKQYAGVNYTNIKRDNNEYNFGLGLWKRDFGWYGLTPRLNLSLKKITSNSPFEELSDVDATVTLERTF